MAKEKKLEDMTEQEFFDLGINNDDLLDELVEFWPDLMASRPAYLKTYLQLDKQGKKDFIKESLQRIPKEKFDKIYAEAFKRALFKIELEKITTPE